MRATHVPKYQQAVALSLRPRGDPQLQPQAEAARLRSVQPKILKLDKLGTEGCTCAAWEISVQTEDVVDCNALLQFLRPFHLKPDLRLGRVDQRRKSFD